MPEHIGCCIIVQNAAGEVLLAERKGPAYGAGLFGFQVVELKEVSRLKSVLAVSSLKKLGSLQNNLNI